MIFKGLQEVFEPFRPVHCHRTRCFSPSLSWCQNSSHIPCFHQTIAREPALQGCKAQQGGAKQQGGPSNHTAIVPQRSSTPVLSSMLKTGPVNGARPTYTPRDENPPSVSGIQLNKAGQRKSPVSIRKSPVTTEQKVGINNDRIKPKPRLSQGSPSYGPSRGMLSPSGLF
jgi:hypothetical protein